MFLRRIIEHAKAQHWTAIAIDFVIVVVGVFIGKKSETRVPQDLDRIRCHHPLTCL